MTTRTKRPRRGVVPAASVRICGVPNVGTTMR
jgi:hypothetical protein